MTTRLNWSTFTPLAEKQALTDFLLSKWEGVQPESISSVVGICFDAGWAAMALHVSDVDTDQQEKTRTAFLQASGVSDTVEYLDAVGTLLDHIRYASNYNYQFALKDYSYDRAVAELRTKITLLLGDESSTFAPKGWSAFVEAPPAENAYPEAEDSAQEALDDVEFQGMKVSGVLSPTFVGRVCLPMVAFMRTRGESPLDVVVGALLAQGALCRSHVNGLRVQSAIDGLNVKQPPTTDGATLVLPDEPLLMAMARYCAAKMDEMDQGGRLALGGSTLTQILDNARDSGTLYAGPAQ